MLSQSFLRSEDVDCLEDSLFNWTTSINDYFHTHDLQRNFFMIVCGLMMDIMVVTILVRFCFYGTSWRIIIALGSFYLFRAIV
jgi:hypothetical protein